MRAWARIALLALMTALTGGGTALAQERPALAPEELDNLTAQVAAQLRCLVCRGQSVLESNSQLANEMRVVIRDRLAAGETPDEVKAYFVSSYGDYILLRPKAEGVSLLVYLLPALALVGGGLLLLRLFGRWTRTAPATVGPRSAVGFSTSANPPEDAPGGDDRLTSDLLPEEEAWLQERLQGR